MEKCHTLDGLLMEKCHTLDGLLMEKCHTLDGLLMEKCHTLDIFKCDAPFFFGRGWVSKMSLPHNLGELGIPGRVTAAMS